MRHQCAQAAAQQALAERSRHPCIDGGTADVEQLVVLDAGGAGGFAVAAGQAAVQVLLGLLADLVLFEELLDQVDAPARPVELVAQVLVSRAGGVTEAAMHAGAQDAFGFHGMGQLAGGVAQVGLHGQTSAYRRPGLKMPRGSRRRLSAWW
ncbi:hypothetical protein D3C81_1594310 [compost metagenome]